MKNNTFSPIISLIRFPMICGIVLIHSKNNIFISTDTYLPLYDFFTNILSDGIARICVPLFYFISGFLFFHNVATWNSNTYFNKLKSRIKSLLLPYVIYTTFAIVCFALLQDMMPQLLSGANIPISDWNYAHLLKAYWKYGNENIPFVGPLWFIRNLMIIICISPIIYIYIDLEQ